MVLPETATALPKSSPKAPSGGTSRACCVQVEPERTKT
jgi:hypothetical protein